MSEKRLQGRIVNKHDTEANWLKATNFIPMLGEMIIYDPDNTYAYSRQKIGDGVTNVNDLPFEHPQADWNQNNENAADYIKNRTHYDAPLYGYVDFEHCCLTESPVGAYAINYGGATLDETGAIGQELSGYEKVFCVFNGTEYETTGWHYIGSDSNEYYGVGNAGILYYLMDHDTGEPFVVYSKTDVQTGESVTYFSASKDDTCTVKMSYIKGMTTVPLDEKYLPEGTVVLKPTVSQDVLFEEKLITTAAYNSNIPTVFYSKDGAMRLSRAWMNNDGDWFTVRINGIEYRCQLFKEVGTMGLIKEYLGSIEHKTAEAANGSEEFPFLISISSFGGCILHTPEPGDYSVFIAKDVESYPSLPIGCIPSEVSLKDEVSAALKTISYNDLFDKTHGETLVPIESYTIQTNETDTYYRIDNFPIALSNGDYVSVVFDGVTYNKQYGYYYSFGYFGNLAVYPDTDNTDESMPNTGEPFIFTGANSFLKRIHLYIKEPGLHTIEVSKLGNGIKQLDEKYIPDTIARSSDFTAITTTQIDEIFNATFVAASEVMF